MRVLCMDQMTKTFWNDYDLVSAYTPGMSHLALPQYSRWMLIKPETTKVGTTEEFLKGYFIVKGLFTYPTDTKYPPQFLVTETPLQRYTPYRFFLLTAPDYLLAKNQGCDIEIKSAFYIPPIEGIKTTKVAGGGKITITKTLKPFYSIIKDIPEKRRKYVKSHILNLLYKERGKTIYGNVVRGMSNKKSFDTKSGKMFRVSGTEISNSKLASWTTAFIRSVIGNAYIISLS
jgi:hypothetical protein